MLHTIMESLPAPFGNFSHRVRTDLGARRASDDAEGGALGACSAFALHAGGKVGRPRALRARRALARRARQAGQHRALPAQQGQQRLGLRRG
jgi:hypothetical protein